MTGETKGIIMTGKGIIMTVRAYSYSLMLKLRALL